MKIVELIGWEALLVCAAVGTVTVMVGKASRACAIGAFTMLRNCAAFF